MSKVGLKDTGLPSEGLSSYGARYSEDPKAPLTSKGRGFLGPQRTKQGDVLTELSVNVDGREVPVVNPLLTERELASLRAGNPPSDKMIDKAAKFAAQREAKGRGPFIEQGELRMPVGKKAGGLVKKRVDGIAVRGKTKGRMC